MRLGEIADDEQQLSMNADSCRGGAQRNAFSTNPIRVLHAHSTARHKVSHRGAVGASRAVKFITGGLAAAPACRPCFCASSQNGARCRMYFLVCRGATCPWYEAAPPRESLSSRLLATRPAARTSANDETHRCNTTCARRVSRDVRASVSLLECAPRRHTRAPRARSFRARPRSTNAAQTALLAAGHTPRAQPIHLHEPVLGVRCGIIAESFGAPAPAAGVARALDSPRCARRCFRHVFSRIARCLCSRAARASSFDGSC